MLKVEIPGHPNYLIDEKGKVFHRETKEFIELLEGKYTLKVPGGKARVSYDSIRKSLEDAKRKEVGLEAPEPVFEKHETVAVKVEEPVEEDSIPEVEDITKSAKVLAEEEGKFTLKQSVEKCRGFAPLEEIVEKNKIKVDLSKIKMFRDQKKAVLKAIAKK